MSKLKVGSESRRVEKRRAEIPNEVLGREAVVARGDWRTRVNLGSRQKIVNKIMKSLKRHPKYSGLEGLPDLMVIASRIEENAYAVATSQSDYLSKVSWKMLTMEPNSQNPMANSIQSNAAGCSQIIPVPVSPLTFMVGSDNWQVARRRVEILNQFMCGKAEMATDMEGRDWRTQLQPDSRERTVNKIFETLKRHVPFCGPEGLQELNRIAIRFEAKIYAEATSQSDYLRQISLKMLTMEPISQNPMGNFLESNAASSSQNPRAFPHMLKMDSDTTQVAERQVSIPDRVMGSESVVATGMEVGDWRTQLQFDFRQNIINKLHETETLKRHLPFSGPEGLLDRRKIIVSIEEKIYAAATSQTDYLQKISTQMLAMEAESQIPLVNSVQSTSENDSQQPRNPDAA